MAMDVLSEIKAAEEKALEKRRLAVLAAKDALKLAEQENAEIMDRELTAARRAGIQKVDAAKAAAKADLDAHQKQRLSDCNALTAAAELRLNEAVHICLERVLK
jgi:hypothetical protein